MPQPRHGMSEEIVKRLHHVAGATTIYVTHDQEEALAISDTIAVMDRGRVLQVGRPWELYLRPANRFVADFIGTMNALQLRVDARVTVLARRDVLVGQLRRRAPIAPPHTSHRSRDDRSVPYNRFGAFAGNARRRNGFRDLMVVRIHPSHVAAAASRPTRITPPPSAVSTAVSTLKPSSQSSRPATSASVTQCF